MPSHRALALLRVAATKACCSVALVLDSELDPEENVKPGTQNPCEQRIAVRFGIKQQGRPADKWLAGHRTLDLEGQGLHPPRARTHERVARARRGRSHPRLRASNLKDLLLAAPAGQHVTMGVDPRHPHRLQDRHRRRHRQDARPPPPSTRTNRAATGTARFRHHRSPRRQTRQCQPGRHRQRHGQPGNRQARAGRHEDVTRKHG